MINTYYSIIIRRVICVVFAAAGLFSILGLCCQAETISDYNRLLESTTKTLNQAIRMERSRPGSAQPLLDRLYNSIPRKLVVSNAGSTIETDISPLRVSLQKIKAARPRNRAAMLDALCSRTELMRAMANESTPAGLLDVNKANAKLKQILQRREYQTSVADDWRNRITDWIRDLLSSVSVSNEVGSTIGTILLVILAIGLAAILVFVVMRIIAYYSVGKPAQGPRETTRIVRKTTPSIISAIQKAEELAAQGQFREAYRSTYLAAILALDKAKLVKYVDGTTNWEYLRALSRQTNEHPVEVFKDMTQVFDELIYGKREVQRDHYVSCVEKYRELEESVK